MANTLLALHLRCCTFCLRLLSIFEWKFVLTGKNTSSRRWVALCNIKLYVSTSLNLTGNKYCTLEKLFLRIRQRFFDNSVLWFENHLRIIWYHHSRTFVMFLTFFLFQIYPITNVHLLNNSPKWTVLGTGGKWNSFGSSFKDFKNLGSIR